MPPPFDFHGNPPEYVPHSLETAEFVWLRHDGARGPLQDPFDGPFRVLERGDKSFVIDVEGAHPRVSIDRLKIARGVGPGDVSRGKKRGRPCKPQEVMGEPPALMLQDGEETVRVSKNLGSPPDIEPTVQLSHEDQAVLEDEWPLPSPSGGGTCTTRSGRISRPPPRL